jgi:hypothetical protein
MPRERPVSLSKALLLLFGGLAVLFVVVGGLSHGYSPKMIVTLGVSGAILGAIAVPELAPGVIPFPTFWQVTLSVVGCMLFAYAINAAALGYAVAFAIGVVLGMLAPRWVKHVNLP